MSKLQLVAGTTSKSIKFFVQDSSQTVIKGLTGLAFGTSGLTAYYIIEGQSGTTQITLATMTLGTWATGGFIVVDGTNMPGVYELGLPNTVLASGKSVIVYLQGAANMSPVVIEIELTAVNNQSATSFVTSVPSVVGAVGSVAGAVGSVTGNVGGISGVALPSTVPSLAAIQGGLPTDASIQTDVSTIIGAAGVNITAATLSAAGNNAITAALAALAVSVAPTAGTWGEAMAFALAGQGKGKVTYAPPSGINTNDGVLTVYAKDGTTVLKAFTGVNQDANGNITVRV